MSTSIASVCIFLQCLAVLDINCTAKVVSFCSCLLSLPKRKLFDTQISSNRNKNKMALICILHCCVMLNSNSNLLIYYNYRKKLLFTLPELALDFSILRSAHMCQIYDWFQLYMSLVFAVVFQYVNCPCRTWFVFFRRTDSFLLFYFKHCVVNCLHW